MELLVIELSGPYEAGAIGLNPESRANKEITERDREHVEGTHVTSSCLREILGRNHYIYRVTLSRTNSDIFVVTLMHVNLRPPWRDCLKL